jgi:phage virion morphogenesis protein
VRIQVDRVSVRRAKWKIKAIASRADNLTPAWPKVGSYLSQANRKQFTSRGAYYGTPWKPLKPAYAQWKLRNGYGRRVLVLTGAMKISFISRPMSVERYYKQSAVFGSDNRLAPFHQYGTHRNGKPAIPARPIMKVTPKVAADIKAMLQEYVVNGKIPSVKGYL